MSVFHGFVAKPEAEGVNVSENRPIREAVLLVVGITGGALVLIVVTAVIVELIAPMIPPSLEYRLFGGWVAHFDPSDDVERRVVCQRADRVVTRLLGHWPEAPYLIRIAVQPSGEMNAYAMPGGSIVVTTALMETVQDDEELAFVLGHELGHFANRDHLLGLGRGLAVIVISGTLGATGVGSPVLRLIDHVDMLASRSRDRQQEIAADAFGLDLLIKAYGDPRGGAAFLSRLEDEGSGGGSWLGYLRTHPAADERIMALSGSSRR